MTLTKADIVDGLVEEQHLNQKNSKDFVDSLKTKEINSVYDFNLKNTKKYYIVKKTETEKEVRLLQVLKISLEKDKKSRLIKIAN